MKLKKVMKELCLKPVLNKTNGQINFSLKRNELSKEVKHMLPNLKSIRVKVEDFEFN